MHQLKLRYPILDKAKRQELRALRHQLAPGDGKD